MTNPNQWRPMETAPRDGKEVLVYVPHSGIISAWFYEETGLWPHDEPYNEFGEPCNVGYPTHWMPLPDYPDS